MRSSRKGEKECKKQDLSPWFRIHSASQMGDSTNLYGHLLFGSQKGELPFTSFKRSIKACT